jgi:hypothetical protein
MHTLGSVREVVDPALWNMTAHTFEGDYGLAYRIAERLAGRDVGAGFMLALIDFALNHARITAGRALPAALFRLSESARSRAG